jgi:hypothetical protein
MIQQRAKSIHSADVEWRPVVGFEDWYEVSSDGRIRTLPREIGWIAKTGYIQVHLCHGIQGRIYGGSSGRKRKGTRAHVHRIVARAFLGECPEGLVVNHKDANPLNNAAANLEYVTHQENTAHARSLGLIPSRKGTKNSKIRKDSTLTSEQREEIGRVIQTTSRVPNGTWQNLAKKWGVTVPAISTIANRIRQGNL